MGPGRETVVPTRICKTDSSDGAGVATGWRGLWFFRTSVPPANLVYSIQERFGLKEALKRPVPSQKLQEPSASSTENQ